MQIVRGDQGSAMDDIDKIYIMNIMCIKCKSAGDNEFKPAYCNFFFLF